VALECRRSNFPVARLRSSMLVYGKGGQSVGQREWGFVVYVACLCLFCFVVRCLFLLFAQSLKTRDKCVALLLLVCFCLLRA
jgi:hypothetical protein